MPDVHVDFTSLGTSTPGKGGPSRPWTGDSAVHTELLQ